MNRERTGAEGEVADSSSACASHERRARTRREAQKRERENTLKSDQILVMLIDANMLSSASKEAA